jgi:hypothetical protein
MENPHKSMQNIIVTSKYVGICVNKYKVHACITMLLWRLHSHRHKDLHHHHHTREEVTRILKASTSISIAIIINNVFILIPFVYSL